jgi:peptidoglycan/xylan/chitin deacetylase (PgdA/CDA1 family)
MPSLRLFKNTVFHLSRSSGATAAILQSPWRSRQLLILGYHGISVEDEHLWDPTLYMTRQALRSRLETLRDLRCNVLPLAEGLNRLYEGTLPARSVVLTFDDGTADFYHQAYPIIREYQFPITVYWTTFYAEFGRPVPDVALQYLLWKAKPRSLEWEELLGDPVILDDDGYRTALARLTKYLRAKGMDANKKDEFLAELASRLGSDYYTFCKRRMLQIMNHDEAAVLVRAGVDFQIHTHRHRTPQDRDLLLRELEDNSRSIQSAGAARPEHFCYPSGLYTHLDGTLLAEAGIRSAVTCDPALAGPYENRFELPRFIDTMHCDDLNFEAWLSGVPQWLPRRKAPSQPLTGR